jgi:hypothetical protein
MPRRAPWTGALLAALVAALPASAGASSLYDGPGPRPGPDILYSKPAHAPQLSNAGIWHAKPILVSGTSAYRDGEFLYQDFIYDDHGARGLPDPNDPRFQDFSNYQFSAANGTYTYPTDPAYAGNAADLVELRAKPLGDATAFRLTFNTMKDPSLVATTIAIGDSATARDFPYGANASAPAKLFLTVRGGTADLRDAATGDPVTPAPSASVDRKRRQIEVTVPHGAWDPGRSTVRLAAGVGLWDDAAGEYRVPTTTASATEPGGAAGLRSPSAFFNVAFRYDEPWPNVAKLTSGTLTSLIPAWWRDKAQGRALKHGDLSGFHADVDFGKLEDRVDDDMPGSPHGVPQTGPMDRILVSHFDEGQGVDYEATCDNQPVECVGELRGRLQPYAIYVPAGPEPKGGYGMTLLLHSLASVYNQYSDSRNQSQFGERGPGSIVITPEGRGPDAWYWGHGGADTFEVWADVARRYHLDPRWTSIAGYSMGGYGTYKFATQYPDLFARAQPTVGPPAEGVWVPPLDPLPGGPVSNTNTMLPSLRNVPILVWNAALDELVPVAGVLAQVQRLNQLGYRYTFDLFTTSDHLALATNDNFQPAANFLGTATVDRNPPHVTYVVNPGMDFPEVGTVADHAYWLSGLRLRDASGDAPLGKVDARSEGFGEDDPPHGATQLGAGVLTGSNLAMPYTEESRSWGPAPSAPVRDVLHLDLTNLDRVVVNVARARLDCHPNLDVTTDGPATVRLRGGGCDRELAFP